MPEAGHGSSVAGLRRLPGIWWALLRSSWSWMLVIWGRIGMTFRILVTCGTPFHMPSEPSSWGAVWSLICWLVGPSGGGGAHACGSCVLLLLLVWPSCRLSHSLRFLHVLVPTGASTWPLAISPQLSWLWPSRPQWGSCLGWLSLRCMTKGWLGCPLLSWCPVRRDPVRASEAFWAWGFDRCTHFHRLPEHLFITSPNMITILDITKDPFVVRIHKDGRFHPLSPMVHGRDILPLLCVKKTWRSQRSLCQYMAHSYKRRLCQEGWINCWGHESIVRVVGFALGTVEEGVVSEGQDRGGFWESHKAAAPRTPFLRMQDTLCIGLPALCPLDLRGNPPHSNFFSTFFFGDPGLLRLYHVLEGFAESHWWTPRCHACHWNLGSWGWAGHPILWQRYPSVACEAPLRLSALNHHRQHDLSYPRANGVRVFAWLGGPVVSPHWGFLESCLPISAQCEHLAWPFCIPSSGGTISSCQ